MFEYFVRNARRYRYNLMRSITAHDKQQPIYVYDSIISNGSEIPNNATTAALKPLGVT